MDREQQRDIIQMLQSWLTTTFFALSVIYFTFRLTQIPALNLFSRLVMVAAVALGFMVILRYWKISGVVVFSIALAVGVQRLSGHRLAIPLIGAEWWASWMKDVRDSVNFLITPIVERGAMPSALPILLSGLITVLSVLTHWALPIPILNMCFLIAPLFFIEDLSSGRQWLFWLLSGLFGVYGSYAYRQDPTHHDQRPPIFFGALVLVLTFLLQLILPPSLFFNERLSDRINAYLPTDTNTEVSSFSLAELGFYPQGNLRVGGPVTLNDAPYLKIKADPDSFYFRGSAYDTFDGHTWSLKQNEALTQITWNSAFYDEFTSAYAHAFWFSDASSRDQALQSGILRPTLYWFKTQDPTRIVFHGGKPMAMTHLSADPPVGMTTDQIISQYDAKTAFFFSPSGMLVSGRPYADHGLVSVDFVSPVSNFWNAQVQQSMHPVRIDQGERQYEAMVRQRDPELAAILYDQNLDFPTLIQAMRAHFEKNYTYELNVPEIPDDQFFIDHFLTNRKGYCVYFATAYSVLLKDIGYPTRYAEGFIIPQGNRTQDGISERTISAKQAHAWTEIQLEGIGWVPMETTPASHVSALSGLDADQAAQASTMPTLPEVLNPQEESSSESSGSSSSEPSSSMESIEDSPSTASDSESLPDAADMPLEDVPSTETDKKESMVVIAMLLILLLGFVGLNVLKVRAWYRRQNPVWIQQAAKTDRERFLVMWAQMERLLKLHGMELKPSDSAGMMIRKIMKLLGMDANDRASIRAAIRVVEPIIYGEAEPTEKDLLQIHQWMSLLHQKYKKEHSVAAWMIHDVWNL